MAFLEKGFRERGLIDIQKESITYTRWLTSDELDIDIDQEEAA